MGGIASSALYLASPLAIVAHAPATAETFAATAPAAAPEPIAPRPVDTYRLHAVIADVVRRQLTEPQNGSDAWSSADGAPADGMGDASGLDEAVIAAHDQRIALLTQRITLARTDGTATPLFEQLQRRLQRAQAARRVALGRTTATGLIAVDAESDGHPATALATASPRPQGSDAAWRREALATLSRSLAVQPRPSRHSLNPLITRDGVRSSHLVVSIGPSRRKANLNHGTALASGRAIHSGRMLAGTARKAAPRRVVAGGMAADRLTHARHLLATARQLLAPDTAARRHHGTPAIELAGLWHWPGSDSWSLASRPSRPT